jgi:septal ring factor EnvC (AmiA/AmiB activator)
VAVLKWTIESMLAAAAVAISTAGGVYSTVYHGGTVNQQIVQLQSEMEQNNIHVAKHDDELATIQQQNAAMKQSLDDIKDTVHDIQTQVRKPYGDHK